MSQPQSTPYTCEVTPLQTYTNAPLVENLVREHASYIRRLALSILDDGGPNANTEGFSPFPIAADGTFTNTNPLQVQCAAISNLAQHPNEAWLWINFLSHQRLIA
jgi:hypothetical protein